MRAAARFLFVAGTGRAGDAKPRWPDADTPWCGDTAPDGRWVAWRLVGPNNRELGRSAATFGDLGRALAAADLVRTHATAFVAEIASTANRGWSWMLHAADAPVVTSARAFARRQECAYNLHAFLAIVETAELSGSPSARGRFRT
jgi:hypothetical protein